MFWNTEDTSGPVLHASIMAHYENTLILRDFISQKQGRQTSGLVWVDMTSQPPLVLMENGPKNGYKY